MKRPVFGDGAQQRSLRVRKVQGKTCKERIERSDRMK